MATTSAMLSIESFYQYSACNVEMLDSLGEFYNICRDYEMQHQRHNNKHNNHNKHVNTDNVDWKKQEATNWLTTNKKNRDDDEKLYAKIRSILNKLSDENFDTLINEIKKMDINDSDHLDKLAEFIFCKALDEPKFCVRYAKLAYDFAYYQPYNNDNLSFRAMIIRRCQITFNDLFNKTKEKAKGCMMFIAELYNYDLLPTNIIVYCFNDLCKLVDGKIRESSVEFILIFMKTLGENLWKKSNNDAKALFEKFELLLKNTGLSNKEKFCIMDTIDLKKKYV